MWMQRKVVAMTAVLLLSIFKSDSFISSTGTIVTHQNGVSFWSRPLSPENSAKATTKATNRSQQPTSLLSSNANAQDQQDRIIGIATLLVPTNSFNQPSPFGTKSPVENPSWMDAANHLAQKLWFFSNGTVDVTVVTVKDAKEKNLVDTDALVAMGLTEKDDLEFARQIFDERLSDDSSSKCQFALQCDEKKNLFAMVGPYNTASPSLDAMVPWTRAATGQRLFDYMSGLFSRWTSDDFCVALALYFDQFVAPVDWVKHSVDATWEKGPVQNLKEFSSMASKCGPCIAKCLADDSCRTCLSALTQVDTRDQVASYRTIVSYESELLKDFSLCILQKNNIFECDAQIPTLPKVQPLTSWRDKPLTQEAGEQILIGHLNDMDAAEGALKLDVSWKVAAGANVAYDQFPSQHQLFYKDVSGRNMWYDPVFRVETIDGRSVWCKRHYRVRNGPVPGTFRLSVLDNGVTSNEFWTIVGAADDLSWIVFHYAGAASAVGQQYLGGLLCTAHGELPKDTTHIYDLFQSAGIQPWELFVVDNDMTRSRVVATGPPPLEYYRKGIVQARADKLAKLQS